MSTQQKIHIKLQHNNEFRRFVIEPESSFNDLKQKISTILNISAPFSIRYQDEESEWITIESDNELQTGIEISPALLRIQIIDSNVQTPNAPNPVLNSEQSDIVIDEPKWKKYRKCRKENAEKACDENNGDECGKWRRKWRKENSEKDSNENEECGKWRRKRCNRRNENPTSEISLEQNNATSDQPVDGNNNDCPKWKKFKKYRNENSEFSNDPNADDCPKWKRYRKNRNNESNELTDAKDEMKGRRGRRGFGKWANMIENSDSESIEDKTAEEINKEIGSLKEEIKLLMEKKKGLWQEVTGLKEQIKNLRQNNGAKEDIVKLREQIVEKKKACQGYQIQVVTSKNRIWKLKSALVIKAD